MCFNSCTILDSRAPGVLVKFPSESKELKIPAYIVFTNQTLFELVKKKPKTINELYKITGLGEERINNFSNDLLAIIKNKKN